MLSIGFKSLPLIRELLPYKTSAQKSEYTNTINALQAHLLANSNDKQTFETN